MVLVKRRDPYRISRGRLTARPKKNMNRREQQYWQKETPAKVTCREADLPNDKRAMH